MYFCSMGPDTIALSIPILAVCGGVLIAITAIIVKGRKEEQEHRERVVAMEKGIMPPPPPEEVQKPKHSDRRAGGLVMTGIGLALTIAISVSDGVESGVWGLIPLFIGIGLLIAGAIDKREHDERDRVARNRVQP
jgi:hypothetical protein